MTARYFILLGIFTVLASLLTVVSPSAVSATTVSAACGAPMPSGTTTQSVTVNGTKRTWLQIIPSEIPQGIPVPIIMGFHGGSDTASNANTYMGITSNTPAVYVYPQAGAFAGGIAWNVDPAGNDFPFIDALLTNLKSRYCVNPARVFATGKSNGGFMANSLLCLRPNSFRAVASVAGGGPQYNCSQARTFFGVHGTSDTVVPIGTGRYSRDYWQAANQYGGTPPVPVNPIPCVSYPRTINPVIWCEHSGGHIWPSWAGAAIRNWFLSL